MMSASWRRCCARISRVPSVSYNLNIAENPNYLVGPGFLVHNQGGFDTKLGGDITIYRGTNDLEPDTVYVGKTTDVTAGGKSRGIKERQKEHRAWAALQLKKPNLSADDRKFYEFMENVTLQEVVTGLNAVEQGQFLEQKNLEIEEGLGNKVINRAEVIKSPARLRSIEEQIKNDPHVQNAGFCKP